MLERNDQVLKDVEQIVEPRYRVGQGNQQEVLRAQLQIAKILQEIAMHHREVGQLEAQLKQLLNRPQGSPDIQTAASMLFISKKGCGGISIAMQWAKGILIKEVQRHGEQENRVIAKLQDAPGKKSSGCECAPVRDAGAQEIAKDGF